jgi:4-amino-4-deoxy-L-arabinose transferase-like glycosyltransferase
MGAMARVYLSWQRGDDAPPSWTVPAIFWTALAGGILIKGPLPLMVAGLCIVALAIVDRSAAWLWRLRPFLGLLWLLVLVLPWFIAILVKSGDAFIEKSLGDDLMSKVLSGQESHGALPGTYFILFWLTFWPGAALAGLATPAVWRARREPAAQFLLAWLVPSWIVFELVPTKLPHYVLPLYPAIAILIVGALELRVLANKPWMVRGISWWFTMPAIMSIVAISAAIYFTHQPAFLAWPFAAAATIFGLFAWRLYDESHAEHSLLNSAVAALLLAIAVYGVVVPSLKPLFPSVELARALRNVDCHQPMAATAGFHEPSLVFMVGTSILPSDASGAADFLSQGSCRFALIESRQERAFAQRAEAIGLHYAIATRVDGYNYSLGRAISVAIFRSEAPQ